MSSIRIKLREVPVCPVCQSKAVKLVESHVSYNEYDIEDDIAHMMPEEDNFARDTEATCPNLHQWAASGPITDLGKVQ